MVETFAISLDTFSAPFKLIIAHSIIVVVFVYGKLVLLLVDSASYTMATGCSFPGGKADGA
jgi:hypothetical protein